MLKVKVDRETMVKAIEYHANEGHGLTPVLDDDSNIVDWALWVLADVSGYQSEELDAVTVTVDGESITVGAPAGKLGDDVIDAVKRHILL